MKNEGQFDCLDAYVSGYGGYQNGDPEDSSQYTGLAKDFWSEGWHDAEAGLPPNICLLE